MIYAIGDIHGQKQMLDRALALIEADGGPDAHVVFLGDYTDRGPDSRGVLDLLIAGGAAGRNWHPIKGNHDRMFHNFVTKGIEHDARVASGISWVNPRLGGVMTLASYGIGDANAPRFARSDDGPEFLTRYIIQDHVLSAKEIISRAQNDVPKQHLDFLDSLPLTHQAGALLFVHAGLRPGIALPDQDPEDLLWIRGDWLSDTRDHGPLVVHGHTALDHPQHHGNRVNLDGGAGYGNTLHPAVFEGRDCWLLTPDGRKPLRPLP